MYLKNASKNCWRNILLPFDSYCDVGDSSFGCDIGKEYF